MWKTVIWSVAEVACAIICACIPTLRPLLPRFTGWQRHVDNNLNELSITPRTGEVYTESLELSNIESTKQSR
jgi:hypothetical protein